MCGSKGSPPSPSAGSTAQQGTTGQTGASSQYGVTQANPFAAALYQQYLGSDAQALRGQPMTPQQLQAASNLYSLGVQAGTFDPNQVANLESPFVGDVVNKTQAAFRNANRTQANDLLGGAIRSGNAFGGDRAGVAEAALAGQQTTAQAPVIAGLYQAGYGQALDEYNRLKQMGLTGAGQAVQGANITGNRPFELANWYASQIGGLGPLLGQSTSQQGQQTQMGNYAGYYTPPQPNPWTQGLGLGLTALGALGGTGMFTSPSYYGGSPSEQWLAAGQGRGPWAAQRRGGLVPRQHFQAGGLSMPSNIEYNVRPLSLATRSLPSINLSMPGLAQMQIPRAPPTGSAQQAGNPWMQGASTLLKGMGSLGKLLPGSSSAPVGDSSDLISTSSVGDPTVRGGLYAHGGYAEGDSEDTTPATPAVHLDDTIEPLQLQSHGLENVGLSMPSMGQLQIPGAPGQSGTSSVMQPQGSSSSSSGSGTDWLSTAVSIGAKVLPFLLLARGGSADASDRGLAGVMPRGFYGPDRTLDLPDTPDAFREKYGRDPSTDYELEHYFGPPGSPLLRLKPTPKHFQSGGDSTTPGLINVSATLPGITGGLFEPRGAEPVQSEEGPDATINPNVNPQYVALRSLIKGVPAFPRDPTAHASPEAKPIAAAYTPSVAGDVPGLGIRPPTAMQQWATNPFTQAGLAMLSSRSPYLAEGIGTGLRGAQAALQQERAAQVALDTPHKLLADGPTYRYLMADGRMIDTKVPNPGYQPPETEESKAKKAIAGEAKAALAKGYRIVRDPTGKVLSFETIKGGPADLAVIAGKEGAKSGWMPTPSEPAPKPTGASTRLIPNGPLLNVADIPEHVSWIDEGPFDYSQGDTIPRNIPKGAEIPPPAPVKGPASTYSSDTIAKAAEDYLLTGKLPPTRAGKSPVAVQQQTFRTTVENYGNTLAKTRGITAAELARLHQTAPQAARWFAGIDSRTTGSLGTAIAHLNTLRILGDAYYKGTTDFSQTWNRIRAKIGAEFGNKEVTTANAGAQYMGVEIMKALGAAGAGGMGERAAAEGTFQIGSGITQDQFHSNIDGAIKFLAGQLGTKERQANSLGVAPDRFKSLVGDEAYEAMSKAREEEKPSGAAPAAKPAAPNPHAVATDAFRKANGRDPKDGDTWTFEGGIKGTYDAKTRTWGAAGSRI